MHIIGLTGGIASGKSTVSTFLQNAGITVIDADKIAREVVLPNTPAYHDIVQTFGADILLPDQHIDRKKLGTLVFSQPEQLQTLNQITHPRIAQTTAALFAQAEAQGICCLVYEVPLLFENNLQDGMHATILVSLPPDQQLQRLLQRDPITPEQAKARIHAQMPLEEKQKLADHIIDNSQSIEHTIQQTIVIWNLICPQTPLSIPT